MYDALLTAEAILNGDGLAHELRVIGEIDGERVTESGRFDNPGTLAAWAERCDGKANIYLIPNPCKYGATHVLKRGRATSDGTIAKIRWLLIDWDSEEYPTALLEHLESLGFPEPFVGFSGHGWWLLYRIDQENTKETAELRRRVLYALEAKFPAIDTTVYNASRIMRCFGTLNVKEPSAPVRSRVERVPDTFTVVSNELLEKVAEDQPELPEPTPDQGTQTQLQPILDKLAERDITVAAGYPKRANKPGDIHQLSACPFYPDKHHDSAAALYVWDDGNIAFSCLGATCKTENNRILALLELLDLRMVASGSGVQIMWASDVSPRRTEYVWGTRFNRNEPNAIVGDEKIGKGLLLVWTAKQLSTGELTGAVERCLYVSAEEDHARVIIPRLIAADADRTKVAVRPLGSLGLPDALPELAAVLQQLDIHWLLLDPINKQFSPRFDPDSKRDVAAVLGALAKFSTENEVTVVGSLHTNRMGSVTSRDRWAHSQEFRRAVRSAILIGRQKDDGRDERTIVHDYNNYALESPALRARIETRSLALEGEPQDVGYLVITGETDAETRDLFLASADREGAIAEAKAARTTKAACMNNIRGWWVSKGMPPRVPAVELQPAIKDFDKSTVARARGALGIQTEQEQDAATGEIKGWVWIFPDTLRAAS